jgi:hypothetical protein
LNAEENATKESGKGGGARPEIMEVSRVINCKLHRRKLRMWRIHRAGRTRMAASHGRSWQTARAATLALPGRATSSQVSWHWAGDVNSTGKIEQFKKKISVYSGNGFLGFFLFLAKLAIIHRKQFLKKNLLKRNHYNFFKSFF